MERFGTPGPDNLIGSPDPDLLRGFEGPDTIQGLDGDDLLVGNQDNDQIHAGAGNDTVHAGQHDDLVEGGDGEDLLNGHEGNDILNGGWGIDTINGHGGDDIIHLGPDISGPQRADGGDGQDTFVWDLGGQALTDHYDFADWIRNWDENGPDLTRTYIHGGSGSDTLRIINNTRVFDYDVEVAGGTLISLETDFPTGNVRGIAGMSGNSDVPGESAMFFESIGLFDVSGQWPLWFNGASSGVSLTVSSTAQNDFITTGRGNDWVHGHEGADVIDGGLGSDTLWGGFGDDTIQGGDDFDLIISNQDNDVVFAGAGNDRVHAGQHADLVWGEIGDDTLNGNQGNDTIHGGQGGDTISGGFGVDVMTGGKGRDTFLLLYEEPDPFITFEPGVTHDLITDFTPEDDVLEINATGTVIVQQNNLIDGTTGVIVQIDQGVGFQTVAFLAGVDLIDLTAENFMGNVPVNHPPEWMG